MDFLTSEWFMWVVVVIVFIGILGNFIESFSEFEYWDVVWYGTKKVMLILLGMIFLPLILIFGRTKERKP